MSVTVTKIGLASLSYSIYKLHVNPHAQVVTYNSVYNTLLCFVGIGAEINMYTQSSYESWFYTSGLYKLHVNSLRGMGALGCIWTSL